ncbi:MAG: cytochrome-c peroxidase [Campylobacterota bacterium]|nr:cytochrome-c peroxidase [Campylobacterota bacterium]
MKKLLLLMLVSAFLYAEPISPIPLTIDVNKDKVTLGKKLFFDTILSADDTISCASCHDLENGGDDGLQFSFGIKGQEGDINAPTVLNAVYNFRQFWNGSAKDLAHQAEGPIENPVEMGIMFQDLIQKLEKTHYQKEFETIYDDGITKNNITDAIAEFEKTLITPNAPFDRYLRGDKPAITQKQKDGYELFKSKGCIVCHHGINVGGNLYNKFGVMEEVKSKRLGRYEVTKKESDKYYFKVPSLRNIEHTSPYLHDGRYKKLDDVVKFMARYQLGRTVTEDEIEKIVSFLKSLSGEVPLDAKRQAL